MGITEAFNAELRRIWTLDRLKNGKTDQTSRWPMQYPELHEGWLTFIGLNPSHQDKTPMALDNASSLNDEAQVITKINDEYGAMHGKDGVCEKRYPYYTPFTMIASELYSEERKEDWQSIDIFAIRMRSQKTALELLGYDDRHPKWSDFAIQQWSVFARTIKRLKPSLIVVVNAKASDILSSPSKEGLTMENGSVETPHIEPDEPKGCYHLFVDNRNIPIFFSGMLSGQRALDTYSRSRLIWHIKRVLALEKQSS